MCKRITNPSAVHGVDSNGHKVTGNILRNDSCISVHGSSASRMSVEQTTASFVALRKRQINEGHING